MLPIASKGQFVIPMGVNKEECAVYEKDFYALRRAFIEKHGETAWNCLIPKKFEKCQVPGTQMQYNALQFCSDRSDVISAVLEHLALPTGLEEAAKHIGTLREELSRLRQQAQGD